MLRDRRWKAVYRSESDSILDDFYIPALRESTTYDRAVGYFSAAMLSYAAQGVSALVGRGGRMRLIFGGELAPEDSEAIQQGYELRQLAQRLGEIVIPVIEDLADALARKRLEALAWLIANGHLEIKIALKPRGMYHEKIGIFTDVNGDRLVFQGSANESVQALLPDLNFESINVFPSWRPELEEHSLPYVAGFESLWGNRSKGTYVVDFPEAARLRLIDVARKAKLPTPELELALVRELLNHNRVMPAPGGTGPSMPSALHGNEFALREHQRSALNAWKANDLQGILAMATGSGKTVTALAGITALYASAKRLFVVIAVPYQALADQWVEEIARFGVAAIPCYAARDRWLDQFSQTVTLFASGAATFACCVVVNRTLASPQFQALLSAIDGRRLAFIGDECHHHGAEQLSSELPMHARVRLGLSATPRHYMDDERTARINKYYGGIVYEYSLSDALRDGVLAEYSYHVHPVELTIEEAEQYAELSQKISRLAAVSGLSDLDDGGTPALQMLLFKRARLLGNAQNKVAELRQVLRHKGPRKYSLVYCGDGSTELDDDGNDVPSTRQVDDVCSMMSQEGWKVSTFTARESRGQRTSTLDSFRLGLLDAMVAIRCLDEGIDVPDCRTAYILASSRNPKQFIQRRGRILRRAPGKESAEIHDFLTMLPTERAAGSELERRLLTSELARVAEFGKLATNFTEVAQSLEPITTRYDLGHHLFA